MEVIAEAEESEEVEAFVELEESQQETVLDEVMEKERIHTCC